MGFCPRGGLCVFQTCNCAKQFAAMANRGNSQTNEIVGSEFYKNCRVDVVVAEGLLVLLKTKAEQPVRNIHSHPVNLTWSCRARAVSGYATFMLSRTANPGRLIEAPSELERHITTPPVH